MFCNEAFGRKWLEGAGLKGVFERRCLEEVLRSGCVWRVVMKSGPIKN